jgi:hypothetical protein
MKSYKEYKNILLDYNFPIIVFTDHKNNTFNGLKANTQTAFCASFYSLKNME